MSNEVKSTYKASPSTLSEWVLVRVRGNRESTQPQRMAHKSNTRLRQADCPGRLNNLKRAPHDHESERFSLEERAPVEKPPKCLVKAIDTSWMPEKRSNCTTAMTQLSVQAWVLERATKGSRESKRVLLTE